MALNITNPTLVVGKRNHRENTHSDGADHYIYEEDGYREMRVGKHGMGVGMGDHNIGGGSEGGVEGGTRVSEGQGGPLDTNDFEQLPPVPDKQGSLCNADHLRNCVAAARRKDNNESREAACNADPAVDDPSLQNGGWMDMSRNTPFAM